MEACSCNGVPAYVGGNDGPTGGNRRRRAVTADADPNSTLEASWEALNVKKFDLAFAVDPLFHKTSAQFDAGGASGASAAALGLTPWFSVPLTFDLSGCSAAQTYRGGATEPGVSRLSVFPSKTWWQEHRCRSPWCTRLPLGSYTGC